MKVKAWIVLGDSAARIVTTQPADEILAVEIDIAQEEIPLAMQMLANHLAWRPGC